MRLTNLLLLVFVLVLQGCASKISSVSTQPKEATYSNVRTFDQPYDKVWKATVDSIGSSFFILDNIEKDSGIMGINFTAKNPADYIDCGTVLDEGTIMGKPYSFSYEGTAPSIIKNMVLPNGVPVKVLRTFKLQGKANIIVKKNDEKSTQVRITTRYVPQMTYSGEETIVIGNFNTITRPFSVTSTMEFTGKESGSFETRNNNGLTCRSTMGLENNIFDLIQEHLN